MDILSLSPFLPLHLSNPCLYPENRALKGPLDWPSMDWAVYLSATTVNFSLVCHRLSTEKAHWVGGLLSRADYLGFCQPIAKLPVAWNWPWWNYLNHRNHQKLQTRACPTPQSQFASTTPVLDFFESLRRTGRIVSHYVRSCSVVSDSATPRTVARQAPLSMEFSKQEYWSELPIPTQRYLPDSRIESESLTSPALAGRFYTTEPPGKPVSCMWVIQ